MSDLEELIEIHNRSGLEFVRTIVVDDRKVATAFFKFGESCFEGLAANDPSGTVARFIERNGGRTHHPTLAVNDVEAEIAFLHPESARGAFLEVCAKAKA